MTDTCAYCKHHCWHDVLQIHFCLKEDDHEEKPFDETCIQFRKTTRCRNVTE